MAEQHFYPAGDNLLVAFYLKPVKDEEASREAGCLKCRDVEYIVKMNPGDRTSRADRPVRQEDRERFAEQYDRWKRGQESVREGVPLEDWAGCTRSQVEELRHHGVRTVEQMAGMSDAIAQRLGLGYPELRQRARDFLESAKGEAAVVRLRADLSEARGQMEAAREQLADARREIERLRAEAESAPRKKQGKHVEG